MFASNMSFEEVLKYSDIPVQLQAAIDKMLEALAQNESEIKSLRRSDELTNEQVCFARELVESIDHLVNIELPDRKTGVIVDFKKAYKRIRDDTYFEI